MVIFDRMESHLGYTWSVGVSRETYLMREDGICVSRDLCPGSRKNRGEGVQMIGALHSQWSDSGMDIVLVLDAGKAR